MAMLRKMVESKRNHYFNFLVKSGVIDQDAAADNYTLTEVLDVYTKWRNSR
ncbi:hypothetical protein [Bacillus sp. FJAT-27225]|uniref:hypothetical protein n=1 Tax=Bacillus sp. FJAT-27225 TaxID=1743144 RepID=UPI0015863193|nr:hypothetical protein [Bacillus sp. FJAT-27225]